MLVALAATRTAQGCPDAGERATRTQRRSFLVPGSFGLLAIGVLAGGARHHASTLGVTLAVLALSAAWVRTALAVREVVSLADSRRQARTDSLTGLPNRRAFYDLLPALLDSLAADHAQAADDAPGPATLLLLDLDRFKEINDALGHQVGDDLLREVSHRLAAHVPPSATLARLDGDNLAILLPPPPVRPPTD